MADHFCCLIQWVYILNKVSQVTPVTPRDPHCLLTCTSGSLHVVNRAAAETPSRSEGLQLALRQMDSMVCYQFYPKITEGNATGSIKQRRFEQKGTQKPPKNGQPRELMDVRDLMTPLIDSELCGCHQGQD